MPDCRPAVEAPRTVAAKKEPNKLKRIFKILGPGLITGASDDDPSGIVTYAQAGAQFGMAPLWTALFTFPLMATVQYICSKIGLVTGKDLAEIMRMHYAKWLLFASIIMLLIANTINAGADIGAIGEGLHIFIPSVPAVYMTVPVTVIMLAVMIKGSYKGIASIFKWLSLALLGYIISSAMTHPQWIQVVKSTLVPHVEWSKDYMLMLVAILGTTISPYLFFWQTQAEVEEQRSSGTLAEGATKDDLKYAALDVNVGMLFSNAVMFFIILACASTLHQNHITEVKSAEQAASALTPFAGRFASYLFAAGLIGTGFLAVPVLVGSSAYAIAKLFRWKSGLDKKPHQAPAFYGVLSAAMLLGLALNFLNINVISALYWTAVINGLLAPPLLIILMLISNNKKIMGDKTNSPMINAAGWAAATFMTLAAVALIYTGVFMH